MGRLPNVLVPGAQKCGTTSLVRALERHPDCALARPKEPSFFCRVDALDDLDRYRAAFSHVGDERAVIDASTAYMVDPAVPLRARQRLGAEIQVVFILRDPAERALSAYWHLAKRGAERRAPEQVFAFEGGGLGEAIEEESRRLAPALAAGRIDAAEFAARYDDALWPFRYLANGCYLDAIRRWQEVFGAERVLCVELAELRADPAAVLGRVTTFLGLGAGLPADALGVHNRTRVPRRGALARGLRATARWPGLRGLRRSRWYERALFATPPASPELEERLAALYAPAQRALAQHLDPAPPGARSDAPAQPPSSSAA